MDAVSAPQDRKVAWWRKLTLRDVLFLTLPPLLLGTWLFLASVRDYWNARRYEDWWSAQTSVRKFGWQRLRTALDTPSLAKLEAALSPERDDVPLLRLYVDRHDFDRIDANVGERWGEWVDVQIDDHGELIDAKLRFRGDGSAHWTTEKKSFTLKTKSGSLYKGFRTLAFSVKDVLPQYLAASLATEFGLLAPEQQVVPVFLNDRFYGLHRFVEPIDESFLRRNLRMPGNVFRADTAERGDYFKDLPREVFRNPYIWDRAANNDRPGAFGTKLLGDFLADLNDPSRTARERLEGWLDEDELARLLAYLLVVGDPYHMSGVHNQFWYEDPVSGTLHPVPWDVRLLDLEKPPRGSNINRFWRIALEDPRLWTGAMKVLAEKLKDDSLLMVAQARLAHVQEHFADAIAYDRLRSGVIPPIGDAREALATLRKNIETLRGWASDARAKACSAMSPDGRLWTIDVVLEGRAPLELTGLEALHVDGSATRIERAWIDSDHDGGFDAADEPLVAAVELGARIGGAGAELFPSPCHVRILCETPASGPAVSDVLPVLARARGGARVSSGKLERGAVLPMLRARALLTTARASSSPPEGERPALVWQGEIRLTEDVLVPAGQRLVIEAGATLTLEPDISIECRGQVLALGTAELPITVHSADAKLPWGVFALQGAGANGSRLEHMKFLGGGARQVGRVEYKGAVCVHYATGVVFDRCEFAHNQRCDDLINVVKSEVEITNSHFHHANADSIDYDMSGGLIAWNTIEGSGNDGLDLMTCWPRVIGNRILGSGDKGLSVGEDSSPLLFENLISGCVRGLEVKDRSEPFVFHSTLENNELGVYANKKNWRYGEAGWPKFVRSVVAGNQQDYKSSDGASRTIADARVDSDAALNPGEVEWAYQMFGVRSASAAPGAHEGWQLGTPVEPRYEGTFAASFADTQALWRASGLVRRVCLRQHDLEATLRTGAGRVEMTVDWNLEDSGLKHELVVELASDALPEVRLFAVSAAGTASQAVQLSGVASEFRYAALNLPPGRYTSFGIDARAAPSGAKIRVHSWRVLSWPADSY